MARLIVDDGAQKRRFQLKPGKISIGSGQSSKLRLEDSELAERHAEIEFDGEAVCLRLARGVAPARAGGQEVRGEWTMVHGQPVELGGVSVTVEYEGGEGESLVARRGQAGKAQRSGAGGSSRSGARATGGGRAAKAGGRASGGRAGGRAAARAASDDDARPVRRRNVKKSMPTWAILLIFAVVLAAGYKMSQNYATAVEQHGFVPQASYDRIQEYFADGNFVGIEVELEKVFAHDDLTAEWRTTFEKEQARLKEIKADRELIVYNQEGTKYLDSQIKRFEEQRLTRSKEVPKVRVFLKRLKEFKERWPKHPELDWVRRTEERYEQIASLDDPPTFDDIAFEGETLVWARPRDYKAYMALLEDFAEDASPEDRDKALALIDQRMAEQEEYYDDRLKQAKHEWERETGQGRAVGVEELVQLVIKLSEQEMVDEAARRLLLIPDIDERWGGYERDRPDTYAELIQHPKIRAHLEALGRL